MGFGSIWHWLVVLVIVLVLFGRGRVAEIMGDFGKGINSFKKGMSEGEEVKPQAPAGQITPPAGQIPPPPEPGKGTLNGDTVVESSQNKSQ
jgi:sec-independent protein translocase protein TatA